MFGTADTIPLILFFRLIDILLQPYLYITIMRQHDLIRVWAVLYYKILFR
jgi:hypothetical protein